MKLHLNLLLITMLISQILTGQNSIALDLISSTGDYFHHENVSMSFSLGEIAINTLESDNQVITQGFQQSRLPIFDVYIVDPVFRSDILIYPNPAYASLFIDLKQNKLKEYNLEIYNLLGEKVHDIKLNKRITELNIQPLQNSIYILKIKNADNQVIACSKLSKK